MRWIRALVYIITVIGAILGSAKGILDWLGRLDFIISHQGELGWIGKAMEYMVSPPWWLPWLVMGFGLIIIWGENRYRNKINAGPNVNLTFESDLAELPTIVPPEGQIFTLPLFYSPDSFHEPIGLSPRHGHPGSPLTWFKDRKSPQVYRCQITNYGNDPILQVTLTLRIHYRPIQQSSNNPSVKTSGDIIHSYDWSVLFPKIDPGKQHAATFYVHNTGSYLAVVIPPRHAKYIPINGTQSREVPLKLIGMMARMTLWPIEPVQ
jgi:hypothetical protein